MPFSATTPALVRHAAAVVFFISAPLTLVVLVAWAFEVWPPMHDRPYLVVMVYLLLLSLTLGAAVVASVAHCHITVSRSFAAGMRAAQAQVALPPDPRKPVALRVVHSEPPNYLHSGAQN